MPSVRKISATAAGLALVSGGLAAAAISPAQAAANDHVVISEAYGGGGNSGSTFKNDFIELYNPTSAAVDLSSWSVQYRSSGSTSAASGVTKLTGTIPAGEHYLVQENAGSGGTTDLPTADDTGTISMGGSGFQVFLASTQTALSPPAGSVTSGTADLVDLVGASGGAASYETAVAPAPSNSNAVTRDATGSDTDNNSVDFTAAAADPQNSGPAAPPPPTTTVDKSIAQIQGTGSDSPFAGDSFTYVHTTGVVTAAYPAGGFYGFVIQTPGTGGANDATPGASDAIYVYQTTGGVAGHVGDHVEVTGLVSEFGGLTELTYDPSDENSDFSVLSGAPDAVTPLVTDLPTTTADREAHESELLDVSGQHFTVTNNYSTNQYAEIGLATGDTPLVSPTEENDAQDTAAIAAATAANAARAVTLDDGASINFLPFGGPSPSQDIPLPWLSPTNTIRVSSAATFHEPVILDYRNNNWKFQPTHQVTDEGKDVATFSDTRPENAAPQDVGGDLKLATFNVLNYFPTTGEEFVADGGSCTFYVDRANDPVTDNRCNPNGPRGAAEEEDLQRQQAKIVTAINTLDADIVSLEEIENSVEFGQDRDAAVSTLVDALNADAGSTRWAYAPSPDASGLPPTGDQDVIRTAFIYNPNTVDLVGASKVLVGSAAFSNAREPLAQTFKPKGADDATTFGVIVNHFKSKGSGTDDGTGQGNANPDRVAQAEAMSVFADQFKADRGITKLFLTGDYNAYSMEDPIQALEANGYTNLQSDQTDEWTYNYSGEAGSLDHVFANDAALGDVTGVDIWNINADEAVAFEYSRDNYNATDFYAPNQFRASDHDPEVIGIDVPGFPAEPTGAESSIDVKATPRKVQEDKTRVKLHIRVTSSGQAPTGTVTVSVEGKTYIATLRHGQADVRLAPFQTSGTKTVTITYSGDDQTESSTTTEQFRVEKKHGNDHGHGGGHGH